MTTKTKIIQKNCADCPMHNINALHKLGINMDDFNFVVAICGNPNTGKSTVFNALTGLRQHTGNWPGKTVTRAEGGFEYAGKKYKIVDLPGTYSLLANSLDEEVARDFILFGQPDVTIIVVDATRLERNLNLVLQVLEITNRAVIALNLMDEARRYGLEIDVRRLARDLGVPVIPMVARSGEGIPELLNTISKVANGKYLGKPYKVKYSNPKLKEAVSRLVAQIESVFPDLPNAQWIALRLLDGDTRISEAMLKHELGDLTHGDIEARVKQLQVIGNQ